MTAIAPRSNAVNDGDCAPFLQWALPRLGLRWPGFRKVRRQVCKRIKRRMDDLELADAAAYRARLEADPAEWRALDECCHITISRFFRDRGVFEVLRRRVLPEIAARAKRDRREARIWSAGCASGEEPYTLKLLWDLEVASACPGVGLSIVATDVDSAMLARARKACFAATSLSELPAHLIGRAFDEIDARFCVRADHRQGIDFLHQDLRSEAPELRFDLILCRYVAFTYFSEQLQEQVLSRLMTRLMPDGFLAIGTHERLPPSAAPLTPLSGAPQIFQMAAEPEWKPFCGERPIVELTDALDEGALRKRPGGP